MKKLVAKLSAVAMSVACVGLLGCIPPILPDNDKETEKPRTTQEAQENKKEEQETSIITEYQWQATGDGSLIVCESDGSFKFYQSAEDFTDNYFEGNYEFYMGKKAVTYITTELSEYGVTKEELKGVFDRTEEYDESNFVVFVLNNEACIVDGKNVVESPYRTPYYGFCLESEGVPYLDIANMNSGNYQLFEGK